MKPLYMFSLLSLEVSNDLFEPVLNIPVQLGTHINNIYRKVGEKTKRSTRFITKKTNPMNQARCLRFLNI